jgi:Skp family chaperone for outer membrane proteins
MMFKIAIAATASLLALTPAAQAQGAGTVNLGGPVVAGVCLFSREAVLSGSKVAIYASERIKQITAEAQAEVDGQRKPVDAEIATLRAQAAKMTAEQIRAQEQALGAKLAPIQAKADLRRREIEKTRTDALTTISVQLQPLIAAAYAQKGCGLLFDRNSVLGGNYGNDLTAAVITALDAKLTSIPIQRATLPANAKP